MTWQSEVNEILQQNFQIGQSELAAPGRKPDGMGKTKRALQILRDRLSLLVGSSDLALIIPYGDGAARARIQPVGTGMVFANTQSGTLQIYSSGQWRDVAVLNPDGVSQAQSLLTLTPIAPGATGNVDGVLVARTFFQMNSLVVKCTAAPPGGTISTFDLALYASEGQRDAAVVAGTTFDPVNRGAAGLQYLGLGITSFAAALASPFYADALGYLAAATATDGQPRLYGVIRNNDGANTGTFSVGAETYPVVGSRVD